MDGEQKKNKFEKSKLKCCNCQKLGHFEDECELPKRDKSKGIEKMHIAQEDEDKEDQSSLLMVLDDEHADTLLQVMIGSHFDDF